MTEDKNKKKSRRKEKRAELSSSVPDDCYLISNLNAKEVIVCNANLCDLTWKPVKRATQSSEAEKLDE